MKSIRKFAYAALFTLSALTLSAVPAAAETVAGRFTLAHEVHWQGSVLAAGAYEFSMGEEGATGLLTIRKIDGNRVGYIMLVRDIGSAQPNDPSRLVLVSTPSGSFVDRMELPEFGITLHFKVPAETVEVAQTAALASSASGK